jgi:hypothetical protein
MITSKFKRKKKKKTKAASGPSVAPPESDNADIK